MSKSIFCMGFWKLNSSAEVVVLKSFRKCKGQLISMRELIFYDPTQIYLFCASFFGNLKIVTGS